MTGYTRRDVIEALLDEGFILTRKVQVDIYGGGSPSEVELNPHFTAALGQLTDFYNMVVVDYKLLEESWDDRKSNRRSWEVRFERRKKSRHE